MATVKGCTPHLGCSRKQRPHLSKVGPPPVGIGFGQEMGRGSWYAKRVNCAGDTQESTESSLRPHWVTRVLAFNALVCLSP